MTPGGIPVEVDGFDSAGEVVTRNPVLVGAAYQDERAWENQLLQLVPPLQSHPIAFVAIYVNSSIVTITNPPAPWPHLREPRILFNTLFYRAKKARRELERGCLGSAVATARGRAPQLGSRHLVGRPGERRAINVYSNRTRKGEGA